MRRRLNGIDIRIALSALLVAVVAMGVLAVGVVVVGGQTFADLMAIDGVDVASSESMFQDSVGRVVVGALVLAIGLSLVLAMFIGRRLARPLHDAGDAAQRIARGDYASRLPRQGPDEIVTLVDSFNQMAESLQEQRRIRDQFIADAAHELRTPLTNLQGYLEAMRDGVIAAEPAAFESLLEETGRLVRLSRSLDTLAEGDAGRVMRSVAVDLGALLSSSVELVEPQMRSRGLRLDLRLPQRLVVQGDPDALLQVLGNLLQNAARYTPTGGQVAVWADLDADDPGMARGLREQHRPGHPAGGPAACLRALLSRGQVAIDRGRRRGYRPGHRAHARGGERRQVGVESANGLTRFWFSVPTGARIAPKDIDSACRLRHGGTMGERTRRHARESRRRRTRTRTRPPPERPGPEPRPTTADRPTTVQPDAGPAGDRRQPRRHGADAPAGPGRQHRHRPDARRGRRRPAGSRGMGHVRRVARQCIRHPARPCPAGTPRR